MQMVPKRSPALVRDQDGWSSHRYVLAVVSIERKWAFGLVKIDQTAGGRTGSVFLGVEPSLARHVTPSFPGYRSIAHRDYDQNHACHKHQACYGADK